MEKQVALVNPKLPAYPISTKSQTLQELSELATTLMLDVRPEAGSLLTSLMQLIRSVSTAHGLRVDPEDRRVVLWFDS